MRVLVLHWGTRGGGPQLQEYIGRALLARDDVELTLSYDSASESADALAQLGASALVVGTTSLTGARRFARRIISQPFDAWRLHRFCKVNKVDMLFEVMDHPLQLLPRIFAKLAGVKVLSSVHDALRHSGEENRVLDFLSTISIRTSDGVLTYSESVAEQLADRQTVPIDRIFRTVHGAFGSPELQPRTLDASRSEFVIGFFGRIEKYKGLSRLLEAVAYLRSTDFPARLVIHGRGELTPGERRLANEVGAEVHAGWITESSIQPTIASYDVLALPYDEASQSGVVGYALNAGVPCVGTPIGGLREQLIDSGVGEVASTMSARSFASALRLVLEEPDRYRNLSAAGLRSATTTYAWERVAEDIVLAGRALPSN